MSRVILIESGGVKKDYLGVHSAEPGGAVSSHTFSGVDLGATSSSGVLVIGCGVSGSSSNPTGLLVNGVAATLVTNISGGGLGASIYSITGQSGTGTIEIQSANPAQVFWAAAYKLRGVQNATAHDFHAATSSPLSFDVPARGVGLAFGMFNTSAAATIWGGLTEDFDSSIPQFQYATGASLNFDTAQTPLSVSNNSSASLKRFVGASWR